MKISLFAVLLSLIGLAGLPLVAGNMMNNFGGMMYGNYGYGGMLFGWLFGLLVLVILVLLIVWLIKQIQKKR